MKKLILTLTTLVLLPLSSYGQDAFYASGMLGLTTFDGMPNFDSSTELSYGARAGLLFNDHVAAGIYINKYSGKDSNVLNIGSAEVDATNIMAEVTYFFTVADENAFYISGLLGTTSTKQTCSALLTGCTEESDTSYGASIGYNFMLAPNFSLAPELTYVAIASDPKATSMLSAMANFTIWF